MRSANFMAPPDGKRKGGLNFIMAIFKNFDKMERMGLKYSFDDLLREVLEAGGSDVHIAHGGPPMLRVDGVLRPTNLDPKTKLTPEEALELCLSRVGDDMIKEFREKLEFDFAFSFTDKSRFRGNLYFHKGGVTGAFRPIPQKIPTMEELGLPMQLKELTKLPRGLVLVTGPTGSGKSTTLASMIGHINETRGEHIITIEDPIEFVHESKKSLMTQREVGKDTHAFINALKYSLRQDPDVVLIGELRDLETIGAAITISETGHLVFGTLHTNTAIETINRVVDVFPAHQQIQIRTQLSFVLQGVISQQLLPKKSGGRCLAQEIMIPNLAIRNLIREDKIHQIYSTMQMGQGETNMVTMNQSLALLYKKGIIEKSVAIEHATDEKEMRKMLGV